MICVALHVPIWQRLGCLRWISEYLGAEGLTLAYQAFVHPIAEYDSTLMLGASDTQLYKLDRMKLDSMQHFDKYLYLSHFIPLQKCHHAASIGLLCKLPDGACQEHLWMFCLAFLSSISLPQRS